MAMIVFIVASIWSQTTSDFWLCLPERQVIVYSIAANILASLQYKKKNVIAFCLMAIKVDLWAKISVLLIYIGNYFKRNQNKHNRYMYMYMKIKAPQSGYLGYPR